MCDDSRPGMLTNAAQTAPGIAGIPQEVTLVQEAVGLTEAPVVSVLDWACRYVRRGWSVMPVPPRSKNPGYKGWEQTCLAEADLADRFAGLRGGPCIPSLARPPTGQSASDRGDRNAGRALPAGPQAGSGRNHP
jgi:hypothetical protein